MEYRRLFDLIAGTKQALPEAEPANYDEMLGNERGVSVAGFEPATIGLKGRCDTFTFCRT
jgi:hypothetical protein